MELLVQSLSIREPLPRLRSLPPQLFDPQDSSITHLRVRTLLLGYVAARGITGSAPEAKTLCHALGLSLQAQSSPERPKRGFGG